MKLYKVGGCVRDELLGIKSKDIDYSVEAPSYEHMKEGLLSIGCKIYWETPQYLTIRGKLHNEDVDFVLCRKDGAYSDGRHPDEVTIGTIYDDLARRDFTMNAIAIAEDGTYLDPWGGRNDIKDGLIRCVGSTDRLREDALRIIRAVRFAITKDFELDYAIEKAINDHEFYDLLYEISAERIAGEINKCMAHSLTRTIYMLGRRHQLFGDAFFKMCEERNIVFSSKYYPNQ
jgi:tRNA nucleotidyltransferase (CCA-adding enzyme)